MPAKIIVTESKGGSRISLLGASGKELLGSSVFSEPRAKGATLRALRGLLGDVVVEDHTLAGRAKPAAEKAAVTETAPAPAPTPRARRASTRPAKKAAGPAKKAAPATTRRRAAKAVAAEPVAAVATAPAETPAPKRTRKASASTKTPRAKATKS